jgi:prepilin signal peptidase PulO-like enzyme (type II secretory pathway)
MLVATGAVDYRTGYIFDFATLPSAAISLAVAVATGSVSPAAHALFSIGVPIGALAAWSRGTWIAWGDIKAIFSIVIAFGVTESLLTLIVASLSGILHARALGARSIPFGPHMALGAAIAVAVGPLLDPILMEG